MAKQKFFFAALGLDHPHGELTVGEDMYFRPVIKQGHSNLTPTPQTAPLAPLIVAMAFPFISHEMELEVEADSDLAKVATHVLQLICNLIRIHADVDFTMPLFSDQSWSLLFDGGKHTYNAWVSEYEFSPFVDFGKKGRNNLDEATLRWVDENYKCLDEFSSSQEELERLILSMDALNTYDMERSLTMGVLKLYIGLEAIFGFSVGGSFSLASYVAAFLESEGSRRRTLFNKMIGYSRTRNNIAHGKGVPKQGELRMMRRDLKNYLRRALFKVISARKVPTEDSLRQLLFGP